MINVLLGKKKKALRIYRGQQLLSFVTLCSKVKLFHGEGLTGEIQFKLRTGERRIHDGLDIVNIVQNRTKKVCE